jgi:hypothetical protein
MIACAAEETLLDDFVRSCAFIHDDWIPASGRADWGAYDTNPFLLGADICVVNTLRGFGQDYLDYLSDLNSLPEHIIIPAHRGGNLTLNLLDDERALNRLRNLVLERQLDISVFYNDDQRGLDRLRKALTTTDHEPTIYPSKESFDAANRKTDGLRYARAAGVPTPESSVCESLDEVLAFFDYPDRSHRGIVIKAAHRKFARAFTEGEVRRAAAQLTFPLLVETLYDVRLSPSVNMVQWRGENMSFAVTDQILHNWSHYGNSIPSDVPPRVARQIVEYTSRIGQVIPDLQGVFGVDYVLTCDDEVYAVDVNPRFCSGTYPQHLLLRLGIRLDEVYARYRLVQCHMDSLSTILCSPEFIPLTAERGEGIFIYDPVVYETPKPVNYFSYLAVGKTMERLQFFEDAISEIVAKYET